MKKKLQEFVKDKDIWDVYTFRCEPHKGEDSPYVTGSRTLHERVGGCFKSVNHSREPKTYESIVPNK